VSTRTRTWIVWALVAVAGVLLLASSLTVWAKRQLLDTDKWVQTSSELLQEEAVQEALATRLVDALYTGRDVEARLAERLPPQADALAAPLAGLVRQAAEPAALALLQAPATQALWEEANRRAHTRLVAVLEGNEEGLVTTGGGDVVLDLRPIAERLGDRLGVAVDLPEDAGQITLLESDELEAAQNAVSVLKALSVFLLIAVVALFAVAVYLAEGFRRRVLSVIGAVLLAVGLIVLLVRRMVGDAVVSALTSAEGRDAGDAVWAIGTAMLRDIGVALVVYGALLLIAMWVAGPRRPAVAIRRAIAPVMRERPLIAFGVVAVVFALVLLWGPTDATRRWIGVLVLAALVFGGVEALRRQTLREFPATPP
jgi:hypothetical protein